MGITHLDHGHQPLGPRVATALERAEAGDRSGFAAALDGLSGRQLGTLQLAVNLGARSGRIDALDAAVALFDIHQARRLTLDRRRG